MTITDIAVLIDINEDELRDDINLKTTAVSKAYRLSKAKTVLEVRQQEIALAKLGSPISIELTQKYIIDQKLNENG